MWWQKTDFFEPDAGRTWRISHGGCLHLHGDPSGEWDFECYGLDIRELKTWQDPYLMPRAPKHMTVCFRLSSGSGRLVVKRYEMRQPKLTEPAQKTLSKTFEYSFKRSVLPNRKRSIQ